MREKSHLAPGIEFVQHDADKKVDVMIGEKLFTTYRWPDNVFKPVLYPILTSAGTEITRGFPLKPRAGERSDHIHQVGNWLTYGNVNGYDFWGNGFKGLGIRSENGGVVKHLGIEQISEGTGKGSMVTTASWKSPAGTELLAERTAYNFIAEGTIRIIDRSTTLTATDDPVTLKDTKEGMFAIRVARELELPSEEEEQGNATKRKITNTEVTGNYRSSGGVTGTAVWGKRAKWLELYGKIGEEKISVVISDHPENPNYPTYWHARGYGLFAANPLGAKDFTEGREELNYVLSAGESLTFRYRIIISSGKFLTDAEINDYADDFARKY